MSQIGQKWAKTGQNRPKMAQNTAKLVQNGPRSGPNRPKMSQTRPKVTKNGPKSGPNSQNWAKPGPKWPKMDQNTPKLAKIRPKLAKIRSNLDKNEPKHARLAYIVELRPAYFVESRNHGHFSSHTQVKTWDLRNLRKISLIQHCTNWDDEHCAILFKTFIKCYQSIVRYISNITQLSYD